MGTYKYNIDDELYFSIEFVEAFMTELGLHTWHPPYEEIYAELYNTKVKILEIRKCSGGRYELITTNPIKDIDETIFEINIDIDFHYMKPPTGNWNMMFTNTDILVFADINNKIILGDDRCKNCNIVGKIDRMACICPRCGSVIWGC